MSKKQWIIRLMQGMVGDYGNPKKEMPCYYDGEAFKVNVDGKISDLDLNWINPTHEFYIIDKKGIPMEEITLCNMD